MTAGAVRETSKILRERIVAIAAHQLEAAVEDIELVGSRAIVRGTPSVGLSLAEIAGAAYFEAGTLPEGVPAGLEASARYTAEVASIWVNATHLCTCEVDPATGEVTLLRYIVSEDCGPMINPNVVEGQIAGGTVQGIGGVLYEHLSYDEDGNPIATTFMDYLLPTAAEVPVIEYGHVETPERRAGRLQGRGRGRRDRRAAGGGERGGRRARTVRRRPSRSCRSARRGSSSSSRRATRLPRTPSRGDTIVRREPTGDALSEPAGQRRRYDSPVRRERAAATRARIVAAGAEILHGYPIWNWGALTVRAVAQRAGVNERTVYRYFATERALRDAVMTQLEDEAGVDLQGLTLDGLQKFTAQILEFVSSFPLEPRTPERPHARLDQPAPARRAAGRGGALHRRVVGRRPGDGGRPVRRAVEHGHLRAAGGRLGARFARRDPGGDVGHLPGAGRHLPRGGPGLLASAPMVRPAPVRRRAAAAPEVGRGPGAGGPGVLGSSGPWSSRKGGYSSRMSVTYGMTR